MHADDFQVRDDLQLTHPPQRMFGACADCAAGRCAPPRQRSRRLFTGLLAATGAASIMPAWAREGVDVGPKSKFAGFVPAEQLEQAGGQQYAQMMQQAAQQRALAPMDHPQAQRLRFIAQRIIPFSYAWNDRARQWKWEVNLLGSPELNAFCMPGGKIAFYYGILEKLKLEDDEVAAIMGHEVAHALREHARERVGKSTATNVVVELGSALLGLGNLGRYAAGLGAQLVNLRFSRDDESEADLVGIELAARAGYDPAAAVRLWEKMMTASKGAPPQWLSTHPTNTTRIRDIQANLPKVEGLYARAPKPPQRFPEAPPLKTQARSG
ncbi:Zn-dependent protease with chaperone function [Pelomonas aquatica]|uniref:Zn-dependent protease with chaperone function n=2 Tax=Pelomonas aquatica TaxID=431058 RepID=A0ABU1ZIT8_9BURK|nr:M48 family metallopeptidase [Pelomonas aquatica]MDR7299586.1 Zn-dependent protease with chaperone function [Pelomonas aquatica]